MFTHKFLCGYRLRFRVIEWLGENIDSKFWDWDVCQHDFMYTNFYFENKKDYIMFILRWE